MASPPPPPGPSGNDLSEQGKAAGAAQSSARSSSTSEDGTVSIFGRQDVGPAAVTMVLLLLKLLHGKLPPLWHAYSPLCFPECVRCAARASCKGACMVVSSVSTAGPLN